MTSSDTIFAVSSGAGRAGIAVIRVSGPGAREAIARYCRVVPAPRRFSASVIRDRSGEVLDKGVVVWLPGPGSATGEDMAEFHVHGSAVVVSGLLEALSGLPQFRLAEPGEFSRRAFVNGRMDLVEVEGLADLLAAQTEAQRRQAMFQMSGEASSAYDSWLKRLTGILAHLEAAIDFVEEEGVAQDALRLVRPEVQALIGELQLAVDHAGQADLVRGGVRVAIVGPPNAGKSSLLNVLARRDAAIVSPIPGTTRDAIEVTLVMAGLPVMFTDTAGIRGSTSDEIELAGMARARRAAHVAHIVLLVSSPEAGWAGEGLDDGKVITVLNKVDLPDSIHIRDKFDFGISVKSGDGLSELVAALEKRIAKATSQIEAPVVVRERHRSALEKSIRHLNDSLKIDSSQIELVAEQVRMAASAMARVTGKIDVEDVLGQIFAEFCIGK